MSDEWVLYFMSVSSVCQTTRGLVLELCPPFQGGEIAAFISHGESHCPSYACAFYKNRYYCLNGQWWSSDRPGCTTVILTTLYNADELNNIVPPPPDGPLGLALYIEAIFNKLMNEIHD